jgi:hypothetical protein
MFLKKEKTIYFSALSKWLQNLPLEIKLEEYQCDDKVYFSAATQFRFRH